MVVEQKMAGNTVVATIFVIVGGYVCQIGCTAASLLVHKANLMRIICLLINALSYKGCFHFEGCGLSGLAFTLRAAVCCPVDLALISVYVRLH